MQEQTMALPTACKKCGQLFDLTYDMQKDPDGGIELEIRFNPRRKNKVLCWECRN